MKDWKIIGQFISLLGHLVKVFKKLNVSLDILGWLVSDGRDYFEQNVLNPLVEEFRKHERVRFVDTHTILVNLDAPLRRLPVHGAKVANKPKGTGWVKVQRVGNDLFIGGEKFLFHFSEDQKAGAVAGRVIQVEIEGLKDKRPLHPNIMDALIEKAPYLIPENWKWDEKQRTVYLCFWDVIFSDADDDLCVRCCYWDGGAWDRNYRWLVGGFGRRCPAACSQVSTPDSVLKTS